MRTRVGLGKCLPVRSAITRCSDATESGPSSSRRTCRSSPAVPSQGRSASERSETITLTLAPASRRVAKARAAAEGESSQCASSTASTTGRSAASARSSDRSAVPTSRRPAGRPPAVRRTATSSACRCGDGRSSKLPGSSSASRSVRPANESVASDSAGRAARTQPPSSCARRTASSQTAVLPIPGSPTIASAASASDAPRNSATAESSGSRPTSVDTARGYADDDTHAIDQQGRVG